MPTINEDELEEPAEDIEEQGRRERRREAWLKVVQELDTLPDKAEVHGPSRRPEDRVVSIVVRYRVGADLFDELEAQGLELSEVIALSPDKLRVAAKHPERLPNEG